MTVPAISVVVPHLNQPSFLGRCLDSLFAQTLPHERFEVVVVDNGARELPEAIVARYPGVRLAEERQPGPGPARNKGIALTSGDILAFVDADCTAHPAWLATIAEQFAAAEPKVVLGGDVRIAYTDPARLTMLEAYESVFAYRQKEYIRKVGFSGTGNLAVRRGDFAAIGPFAGIEVAEDRVWGRQAKALGYRIVYVEGMIVYHPARQSFDELFAKWDRHTHHDFEEWRRNGKSRAKWLLRAGAVALSAPVDMLRVFVSDRLSGLRARLLACWALTRIRLYRARRMVAVAFAGEANRKVRWNR